MLSASGLIIENPVEKGFKVGWQLWGIVADWLSLLLRSVSMYPRSLMSTSCRSLWCPSLSLYLVLAWAPQLCWGIFQGSAPPTSHWPLQEISAYSCSSASILECHCTSGWWASWRHLRRGEDNSKVRLCLNVLCRLPGCLLDQRITKLLCLDTTSSNCFWFIGLSKPFI